MGIADDQQVLAQPGAEDGRFGSSPQAIARFDFPHNAGHLLFAGRPTPLVVPSATFSSVYQ
jgi:hypothetical protein